MQEPTTHTRVYTRDLERIDKLVARLKRMKRPKRASRHEAIRYLLDRDSRRLEKLAPEMS